MSRIKEKERQKKMKRCYYKNCPNKCGDISKISYFQLPNDSRRITWIINAGNPELWNPKGIEKKSYYICEEHFDSKYLLRSGQRIMLSKSAVPRSHNNSKLHQMPNKFPSEIDEDSIRDDLINSTDDFLNVDNFLVNF